MASRIRGDGGNFPLRGAKVAITMAKKWHILFLIILVFLGLAETSRAAIGIDANVTKGQAASATMNEALMMRVMRDMELSLSCVVYKTPRTQGKFRQTA